MENGASKFGGRPRKERIAHSLHICACLGALASTFVDEKKHPNDFALWKKSKAHRAAAAAVSKFPDLARFGDQISEF